MTEPTTPTARDFLAAFGEDYAVAVKERRALEVLGDEDHPEVHDARRALALLEEGLVRAADRTIAAIQALAAPTEPEPFEVLSSAAGPVRTIGSRDAEPTDLLAELTSETSDGFYSDRDGDVWEVRGGTVALVVERGAVKPRPARLERSYFFAPYTPIPRPEILDTAQEAAA